MLKRSFIYLVLGFLLLLSSVAVVYASVSSSVTLKLYYDDGTYITLPAGTYSSLYRANNVWYVNGRIYASVAVAPTFSLAAVFGSIYGAVALAGIIPIIIAVILIVYVIKNQTEIEDTVKYLIPILIVAGIMIMLTSIIVGIIQNAFI
jgi:hypothetical protein